MPLLSQTTTSRRRVTCPRRASPTAAGCLRAIPPTPSKRYLPSSVPSTVGKSDVSLGRSGCYLAVGSQDSGLTGGRLTAHRVLLGLLPLLIDLRVLPRERIRDRVGFLQLFLHPELVVRFGHVPPDSGPQG